MLLSINITYWRRVERLINDDHDDNIDGWGRTVGRIINYVSVPGRVATEAQTLRNQYLSLITISMPPAAIRYKYIGVRRLSCEQFLMTSFRVKYLAINVVPLYCVLCMQRFHGEEQRVMANKS